MLGCGAEKPSLRYNLKVFLKPGGQAPRLQDTAFAHSLAHAVLPRSVLSWLLLKVPSLAFRDRRPACFLLVCVVVKRIPTAFSGNILRGLFTGRSLGSHSGFRTWPTHPQPNISFKASRRVGESFVQATGRSGWQA